MYAATTYAATVAAGQLTVAFLPWDASSFGDIGLAPVIVVLVAPLASLIAAMIASASYRHEEQPENDRLLFWSTVLIVLASTGAALFMLSSAAAVTAVPIGATAVVVLRVAFIERAWRAGAREGPIRPVENLARLNK